MWRSWVPPAAGLSAETQLLVSTLSGVSALPGQPISPRPSHPPPRLLVSSVLAAKTQHKGPCQQRSVA